MKLTFTVQFESGKAVDGVRRLYEMLQDIPGARLVDDIQGDSSPTLGATEQVRLSELTVVDKTSNFALRLRVYLRNTTLSYRLTDKGGMGFSLSYIGVGIGDLPAYMSPGEEDEKMRAIVIAAGRCKKVSHMEVHPDLWEKLERAYSAARAEGSDEPLIGRRAPVPHWVMPHWRTYWVTPAHKDWNHADAERQNEDGKRPLRVVVGADTGGFLRGNNPPEKVQIHT